MKQLSNNVIIVDDTNRVVGFMDKIKAHLGGGHRHRAISVFLFNSQGKVLVQQRSQEKYTCPLLYANACCGNVREGENSLQCAYRRIREELGIMHVKIHPVSTFEYRSACDDVYTEWEVDHVYEGIYDGPITPNPHEVAQTLWMNPCDFYSQVLNDSQKKFAVWVKEILISVPLKQFEL